jgi:hypothetical protein
MSKIANAGLAAAVVGLTLTVTNMLFFLLLILC